MSRSSLVYFLQKSESDLERQYKALREDTWTWSHNFWKEHNEEFAKVKIFFSLSQFS